MAPDRIIAWALAALVVIVVVILVLRIA